VPAKRVPTALAAVDLGSNSFHLVVARVVQGRVEVVDRLKETVRLAAGLDATGSLAPDARERALACLRRFGQALAGLPPGAVRAVGTNALRRARDGSRFLVEAADALGHPVEVISGAEEARLIYAGVAQDRAPGTGRRLVIDIGGGSTELVIGQGREPRETASLFMGCVSWTERFFPKGTVARDSWKRALTAARLELEPLEEPFRALGWDEAIGCSGTLLAVESILVAAGWSARGIDRAALDKLEAALLDAGRVAEGAIPGLPEGRASVLPGGLVLLLAVFDALGLARIETSPSALREGLLGDLLGRITHEDVRDRTVDIFARRHGVDREQAERVERTALGALAQVAETWGLGDEAAENVLKWAARLHEVGLAVSHTGHHRHGAYLVTHSDLPGFSREEQALLAGLIRFHRRKLLPAELPPTVPPLPRRAPLRLTALLRLAVRLNRSRSRAPLPPLQLEARKSRLALQLPAGWLDDHPLTRADLEEEAQLLGKGGLSLEVR